MSRINGRLRPFLNKRLRKKMKNTSFSLISSNCNGAFILHDLGLRFNSPFVNLWIKPKDFLKMLHNLKYYMSLDPVEVFEEGINYPIGRLDDIKVYFMHYDSFGDALNKWNERKTRIDYDNLFILFIDKDGCTYDDLLEFDKLPYDKKVVFTNKPYPEIKSAFYIKGFENKNSVGDCYNFIPFGFGKKYYDQFDYVGWFNK